MRKKEFLRGLLAVAVVALSSSTSHAGPFNCFMRFMGWGWGDGYHVGEDIYVVTEPSPFRGSPERVEPMNVLRPQRDSQRSTPFVGSPSTTSALPAPRGASIKPTPARQVPTREATPGREAIRSSRYERLVP